jgi:hypothetical protein
MGVGGQVCRMVQVGGMEWVQVAGTWNRCRWQAHGMGVGSRHVEWVRMGGWQAWRAGVSVQNKRGSEGVVGRCAEWVQVKA